jgi:antitoxin component YwqK of YwqJK toxin-antitoxin module
MIIGDWVFSGEVDELGAPHGYGECVNASEGTEMNSRYAGKLAHGKMTGIAKHWNETSGSSIIASYVDGKRDGVGQITLADGSVERSQFKNDLRDGLFMTRLSSGGVHVCHYKEGKRHGIALVLAPSGDNEAVVWQDDKEYSVSFGM